MTYHENELPKAMIPASAYDAALEFCNDRRKEKGLEPLDALPPGIPLDSTSCPCANAACGIVVDSRHWIPVDDLEDDLREMTVRGVVSACTARAHHPKARRHAIGDFISYFDNGAPAHCRPTLELLPGESLMDGDRAVSKPGEPCLPVREAESTRDIRKNIY